MLRIVQNTSSAGAKSYYSTADYYTEGEELVGLWQGKGAARLGLTGAVEQSAWDALCDNLHPKTGAALTVKRRQERSVGYDFTFNPPKSVSLLYGVTHDERLLSAFRESVRETMREIEADMQTRVRKGGKDENRTTGNAVWGEFTHFTSRPVDGVPDPHLHVHAFVLNATFDEKEGRWKAGQFQGLKRDAPFYEAVFHSRLAHRMTQLGLAVDRTKAGWEIGDMDKALLDKFSRRTTLIEEKAREEGITNANEKAELGQKTRQRKAKAMTVAETRAEWLSRLTPMEHVALASVVRKVGGRAVEAEPLAAEKAAQYALDHCFERQSVMPERTLTREALRRSYGQASPAAVIAGVAAQNLIHDTRDGRKWVTTRSVLADESWMVDFARRGRGTCRALGNSDRSLSRDWLTDEQKNAVSHVLGSNDRVILVRGAAGVGKTTMMKEAVEGLEAAGHRVFAFAPSAAASRGVQREEGFGDAETVARLLADKKLHEKVRGGVLWIDESGLLGVRTTKRVFELADTLDCRLLLSGDVRQHGSVEAGAALDLLETEAGLVPAEIAKIQRQRDQYRQAVAALSEGRVEEGFQRLEAMGAIKVVPESERYAALATEYVASASEGMKTLVVSPTHAEAHRATACIRDAMRVAGRLSSEQRTFHILHKTNLTAAERSDAVNFSPGDTVIYHQNAHGHRKGERVVFGRGTRVAFDQASRFTVFRPGELSLAAGDAVRITQNGKSKEGKRLNNGDLHTVRKFTEEGDLVMASGLTIAKDFGHLAYGYVVTSHSSQGKSVDKVIIAESAESFAAASREQFYVSVSRGKKSVSIYTDDREALLEAVSRTDKRMSATEFVADRAHHERVMQFQRNEVARTEPVPLPIAREGMIYER